MDDRAATEQSAVPEPAAEFIRVHRFDYIERRTAWSAGWLTPARYVDELIRPLDHVPDPEPVPAVTIAPWPDDRDDEILGVTTLVFADDWGSTPTEADSGSSGSWVPAPPDLSFVAVDDATGDVVGFCLNKRYAADTAVIAARRAGSTNRHARPVARARPGVDHRGVAARLGCRRTDARHSQCRQ